MNENGFIKQPCAVCGIPTHIKYLGEWVCPPHLHEKRLQKQQTPLGVTPRYIWEEKRLRDLQAAIIQFAEANHTIPSEWIEENNELIEKGRKAWKL